MCHFCLKQHYTPLILVLNHYFIPKNLSFYTPWTVGSIGRKIIFAYWKANKKFEINRFSNQDISEFCERIKKTFESHNVIT